MPLFKHRVVIDIARGLRAFLGLEVGLTRGKAPDPERLLESQARQLLRTREQMEQQSRRLRQLHDQVSGKDQQIATLWAELGADGAGGGQVEQGLSGGDALDTRPVTLAVRNLQQEIRTARQSRESLRGFQALEGSKGLKVHLGCGQDIRPGWVNVDLTDADETKFSIVPETKFINYDLRLGLPVEEGSCDCIYSSHFFEHLEYRHGLRLMKDCYRALRPGGTFRIALPTFKDLFARYLQADAGDGMSADQSARILKHLPDLEPGTETMVDWINYGVYQRGEHKYIYDEEKIILLLRKIGYSSVVESQYKEGTDPSTRIRRQYSFYTEAVK